MTILWEFDEKHPKQASAYGAKPHPTLLLCGLKDGCGPLGGLERHGCRVDAVAQARWRRSVIENVTQVRITPFAGYRGPYAPTGVFNLDNVLFGDRLPEARPAGAGIELRLRRKQGRATADAAKNPSLVQVPVGAGIGHLGIGPARYIEGVT